MSTIRGTYGRIAATLAAGGALLLSGWTLAAPATAQAAAPTALTAIDAVSCASSTHCWAAAQAGNEGVIIASTDGGTSWKVQDTLPGVGSLAAIDCPSASDCLALGAGPGSSERPFVVSTTNGGRTWSKHSFTTSTRFYLTGLSCPTDHACWLVGETLYSMNAVVWATTNGGRTWARQSTPTLQVSMSVSFGISCPSTKDCVIVGVGDLTTTNGGRTWSKHQAPGELNVVACPSTKACVAEEDVTSAIPQHEETAIDTSANGGVTWQTRVKDVGGRVMVLGSLSCPTTAHCVSVGDSYNYHSSTKQYTFWGASETTADGGRSWKGTERHAATSLWGVSCAARSTDCLAGGVNNVKGTAVLLRTTDDGARWAAQPLPHA